MGLYVWRRLSFLISKKKTHKKEALRRLFAFQFTAFAYTAFAGLFHPHIIFNRTYTCNATRHFYRTVCIRR